MKILVCPLSSPGFSYPAIAVARELARRGHGVRLAPGTDTRAWHDPRAVAAARGALERWIHEDRPDALLTSALALGPLIAGERTGLPVVVLARASAVLCSGTTAVAVGAMAAGVPLVTVPAGGEQHAIAALVPGAGLGVSVNARDAPPSTLRDALARARSLDPPPRREIQRAFAQIDGPSRAADHI